MRYYPFVPFDSIALCLFFASVLCHVFLGPYVLVHPYDTRGLNLQQNLGSCSRVLVYHRRASRMFFDVAKSINTLDLRLVTEKDVRATLHHVTGNRLGNTGLVCSRYRALLYVGPCGLWSLFLPPRAPLLVLLIDHRDLCRCS